MKKTQPEEKLKLMNDVLLFQVIAETMPEFEPRAFLWDGGNRIEILASLN